MSRYFSVMFVHQYHFAFQMSEISGKESEMKSSKTNINIYVSAWDEIFIHILRHKYTCLDGVTVLFSKLLRMQHRDDGLVRTKGSNNVNGATCLLKTVVRWTRLHVLRIPFGKTVMKSVRVMYHSWQCI